MKVICKEQFEIQACNDNGFTIENKFITVFKGTTWEVSESPYRMVGGEVRLDTSGALDVFWIEISADRFEKYFGKIEEKSK